MTPYLVGDKQWDLWPGEVFGRESPTVYYELLRRAAALYHDPTVLDLAHRLGDWSVSYIDLTHPEFVVYDSYWIGDANLDGEFNSSDLVQVFLQAKYEVDVKAYWAAGDWNGDRRFDSSDLVAALQQGGYDRGPKSLTAGRSVPEPLASHLMGLGLLLTCACCRRRRSRARRCAA